MDGASAGVHGFTGRLLGMDEGDRELLIAGAILIVAVFVVMFTLRVIEG